jgi:hypothetical protein
MTQGFAFGFHAFIAAFAADESEVVVAIPLQIPLPGISSIDAQRSRTDKPFSAERGFSN